MLALAQKLADLAHHVAHGAPGWDAMQAELSGTLLELLATRRATVVDATLAAARMRGAQTEATLVAVLERATCDYTLSYPSHQLRRLFFVVPVLVGGNARWGAVSQALPDARVLDTIQRSFARHGLVSPGAGLLSLPYLYRYDQLAHLGWEAVVQMHCALYHPRPTADGYPDGPVVAQTWFRGWADAMQDALAVDHRVYYLVFNQGERLGETPFEYPWDRLRASPDSPAWERWRKHVGRELEACLGPYRPVTVGSPALLHEGLREGLAAWRTENFTRAVRRQLGRRRAWARQPVFAVVHTGAEVYGRTLKIAFHDGETRALRGVVTYPLFAWATPRAFRRDLGTALDALGLGDSVEISLLDAPVGATTDPGL
ncbi:MAG TPA: hypothetical protein VJU59_06855 [Paraburkholderia sp.]|uniref:hypothetical protein n=1 Tax=Paraburkholderia sp. TaxID=1926495 RepID=UPI002B48D413|nr:hypothetical protein [Paraburkholderia sp.]HKR39393.1 hypothetical protein [Paraburkholderia sp.]